MINSQYFWDGFEKRAGGIARRALQVTNIARRRSANVARELVEAGPAYKQSVNTASKAVRPGVTRGGAPLETLSDPPNRAARRAARQEAQASQNRINRFKKDVATSRSPTPVAPAPAAPAPGAPTPEVPGAKPPNKTWEDTKAFMGKHPIGTAVGLGGATFAAGSALSAASQPRPQQYPGY